MVPAEGVDEAELLAIAVAVEALSDHPLAAAVVRDGEAKLTGQARREATNVKSLTRAGHPGPGRWQGRRDRQAGPVRRRPEGPARIGLERRQAP
ncbi:hypothetical protein ACRAWD_05155 [Caulobacter segnis]